ncbi:FxsB family cyclophane-forming radical SAM/SPASM peptide maturase [Sinosporangium siamense]|uniref:FxsB family cyclophane-forming radical SAM/SPASM peptide maturase n=1 Tax=Sinosporangium siamense TaxID=1367973 RepID=UPI001EF1C687
MKIASRCDLACDHCYIYRSADQGWRSQPAVMSAATMDHTAERIAEHAAAHALPQVGVVLHGGEPLLAGPGRIRHFVRRVREAADAVATRVDVRLQTNAVRLTGAHLDLFDELGVRVGVSLDGDAEAHDRHRVDARGRGSHAAVAKGLRLLSARPALFGGLLCTVDLANDPVSTYEALLPYSPPRVDFLLPHGNWTRPPPGREAGSAATPYGDWLTAVFDRWYCAPRRETGVRLFEEIVNVLLGGVSRREDVGLGPTRYVTVDTDGAIGRSDILKSAYQGAADTGLNVGAHPFDAALPAARLLSPACRACRIVRVCGGGLHPHRYRAGEGFDNPSVYCPDLFRLISHIRCRLTADLAGLRAAP